MTSRISINIHGQNVVDVEYLKTFLSRLRPAWLLVMDNLGLAKELKTLLPETNVIYRKWGSDGDENDHKQYTPGQWVAERLREVNGADVWCYTTNEPAFDDAVMRWHVEVMELASNAGLKLVVGNWSVGKPENVDHDWGKADRLLRMLTIHRKTMVLGLHEYGCGVITSGFVGGPPTELRDAQGNLLHPDFIQPENWPQDTSKVGAMWHCGRFKFMERYCRDNGILPPRMVITEHGFDDVSDIKAWAETLKKTATPGNPGGNIRGWKTLENQWNDWFGWSAQRAYFEQLKYADQHIYQGTAVEAQLVYCWGHSSDAWAQFDIAEARELHELLTPPPANEPHPLPPSPSNGEGETDMAGHVPTPTTLPAFPADFGTRAVPARLSPGFVGDLRIRQSPTTDSPMLGFIPRDGVDGLYIPEHTLREGEIVLSHIGGMEGVWLPVQMGYTSGWVFGASLQVEPSLKERFDKQLVMNMLVSIQAGLDELRVYIDNSISE